MTNDDDGKMNARSFVACRADSSAIVPGMKDEGGRLGEGGSVRGLVLYGCSSAFISGWFGFSICGLRFRF
jgi:hypothetical protein